MITLVRRLSALFEPGRAHLLRTFLVLAVVACVVEGVTIALAVPLLGRLLSADPAGAVPWLIALIAGSLASWTLHHVATLRGFDAATELLTNLRTRVGDHVVHLPLGWFTPENTSRLGQTLSSGVMDILALPVRQLGRLVRAVVTPVTLIVATALFEPLAALAAAVVLPPVLAAFWWAGRLGRRADAAVNAAAADATDRMLEFARSQAVLRAFGRGQRGLAQFKAALRHQQRTERRQLWLVLPPVMVNSSSARLVFLALLATLTALALDAGSRAELATIVALLIVVNRIVEPLSEVAAHGVAIRVAGAQMQAVEAVLDARPLPEPVCPATTPRRTDVELVDVEFGYTAGRRVLDGVSFTMPEGSMTAVVGASGSGKTTLVRLIARFWDVTGGTVRVGGVDVRELSTAQLMALISPVFQDTYLFDGTLLENVRMARPDATEDEITNAAELARVRTIVERLPQGWQTQVGEGGTALSGGERQRVALARTLVKDAPIVLLDEVTGALDAENQAAITEGLLTLRRDRTMLVIAHQLSTIVTADQIVVLDNGRIAERGTHDELIEAGGRYAAFWRARAAAEGWRLDRTAAHSAG